MGRHQVTERRQKAFLFNDTHKAVILDYFSNSETGEQAVNIMLTYKLWGNIIIKLHWRHVSGQLVQRETFVFLAAKCTTIFTS